MTQESAIVVEAVPTKSNPLLTAPILGTLARLSIPNVIAMLATSLVAVAETAYAGQLGTPALAGLALVFPMVMLQAPWVAAFPPRSAGRSAQEMKFVQPVLPFMPYSSADWLGFSSVRSSFSSGSPYTVCWGEKGSPWQRRWRIQTSCFTAQSEFG